MGKPSYEYPRVHPPQPPVQYCTNPPVARAPIDDRFSWVPSPANERSTHSFRQTRSRSPIPPLPGLSVHIQHELQKQEQAVGRQGSPPPCQPKTDPISSLEKHQEAGLLPQSRQQAQRQNVRLEQSSQQPLTQNEHPPAAPEPAAPAVVRPVHLPTLQTAGLNLQNLPMSFSSMPKPAIHVQSAAVTIVPLTTPELHFPSSSSSNLKPTSTTGNTWTYGLLSCAEPTVCLSGLFCPCVLYSRVQRRLQLRASGKDPTNVLGHSTVSSSCVAWSLLCGINGLLTGVQKSRVRRAYSMESVAGNVFRDCLEGCCCCCCVLARNEKEILVRQDGERVVLGLGGYTPPIGMIFAPPPR